MEKLWCRTEILWSLGTNYNKLTVHIYYWTYVCQTWSPSTKNSKIVWRSYENNRVFSRSISILNPSSKAPGITVWRQRCKSHVTGTCFSTQRSQWRRIEGYFLCLRWANMYIFDVRDEIKVDKDALGICPSIPRRWNLVISCTLREKPGNSLKPPQKPQKVREWTFKQFWWFVV